MGVLGRGSTGTVDLGSAVGEVVQVDPGGAVGGVVQLDPGVLRKGSTVGSWGTGEGVLSSFGCSLIYSFIKHYTIIIVC